MIRTTPLHTAHLEAHARMVPFAGWEMPLHYGSQLNEHHIVRRTAGVFDVSHMANVDVTGKDSVNFLRHVLSGDVGKCLVGAGLYTCLLNPEGGIKDDLIVYRLGQEDFRLVVNAGTREKDLTWLEEHASGKQVIVRAREDLCMLALQGPQVREKISAIFPASLQKEMLGLKPFFAIFDPKSQWLVARTGYTGEDGFEIMLPADDVLAFWKKLIDEGIVPCGLGARDTLRLEAGLNLYGSDMDETTHPFETGLGFTVALDNTRDFIGRAALLALREKGVTHKRVGLVADARTILRNHQPVETEAGSGSVTSGSFSPTLGIGIALARVPVKTGDACEVIVRGRHAGVQVIRPPFVRHGQKCF